MTFFKCFFREETSDAAILQRAAIDVQGHFSEYQDYAPTSLFIATWENVGFVPQNGSLVSCYFAVMTLSVFISPQAKEHNL